MITKTKKATLIKTGESILVYQRKLGGWVNAEDYTTIYQEKELKFIR